MIGYIWPGPRTHKQNARQQRRRRAFRRTIHIIINDMRLSFLAASVCRSHRRRRRRPRRWRTIERCPKRENYIFMLNAFAFASPPWDVNRRRRQIHFHPFLARSRSEPIPPGCLYGRSLLQMLAVGNRPPSAVLT